MLAARNPSFLCSRMHVNSKRLGCSLNNKEVLIFTTREPSFYTLSLQLSRHLSRLKQTKLRMDSCIVLNVLILIPYNVVNAGLFTTIDIKVQGRQMAQSDVRSYTLYGHHSYLTKISCTTFIDDAAILPVSLSIQKEDELISTEVRTQAKNGSLTWSTTFDSKSGESESYVGTYVCRLVLSAAYVVRDGKEISNVNFSYLIESSVVIKATSDTCVYESSVGTTGYYGEMVLLFCDGGNVFQKGVQCSWPDGSQYNTHLPVYLNHSDSQNHGFRMPICSNYQGEKNITIRPELTLTIRPGNVVPGPNETKFVCTSDPPRLMYWTFQKVNGDFMDLNTLLMRSLYANTNLTIIQRAGMTMLSINDSNILAKGLKSVICSSYNTTANVSVASQITFDGNYTEIYRNISRIDLIPYFQENDAESSEGYSVSSESQGIGFNSYDIDSATRQEPTMKDVHNSTESYGMSSGSNHELTPGPTSAGNIQKLTGLYNETQTDDRLNQSKPGMESDKNTPKYELTQKYQTTDSAMKVKTLSTTSEVYNIQTSTESRGLSSSVSYYGFTGKEQSSNLNQFTDRIPMRPILDKTTAMTIGPRGISSDPFAETYQSSTAKMNANERVPIPGTDNQNDPLSSIGPHGLNSRSHHGYTERRSSSTVENSTEIISKRSPETAQDLAASKSSPVLAISITLSVLVLLTVLILVAVRLFRGSRHSVSDDLRQGDVYILGDRLPESSNVEDNPLYLPYAETDSSSLTRTSWSNIYTTTNVYSEYLYDVTQYSLVQPRTNNFYS